MAQANKKISTRRFHRRARREHRENTCFDFNSWRSWRLGGYKSSSAAGVLTGGYGSSIPPVRTPAAQRKSTEKILVWDLILSALSVLAVKKSSSAAGVLTGGYGSSIPPVRTPAAQRKSTEKIVVLLLFLGALGVLAVINLLVPPVSSPAVMAVRFRR